VAFGEYLPLQCLFELISCVWFCDRYLLTVIETCVFCVFDLAEHLSKESKLSHLWFCFLGHSLCQRLIGNISHFTLRLTWNATVTAPRFFKCFMDCSLLPQSIFVVASLRCVVCCHCLDVFLRLQLHLGNWREHILLSTFDSERPPPLSLDRCTVILDVMPCSRESFFGTVELLHASLWGADWVAFQLLAGFRGAFR
jgi:hypothetical protein